MAGRLPGRGYLADAKGIERLNYLSKETVEGLATLAVADDPPYMAVKALLVIPANPERELSVINSSITLLDSRTGLPVAVMDGNWVTALATHSINLV